MRGKLVYGAGVNDADYVTQPTISGERVTCPYYLTWRNMLKRCYSKKFHNEKPTYAACTVSNEWLRFMSFKQWMESQDWKGKQIDKDLLIVGNKLYSADTCTFVDSMTNNFTTSRDAARGDWPLGVYFDNFSKKFKAECRNPFTKKNEHLGRFTNPEEAHNAWKARKKELASILAEMQTDQRVKSSLLQMYS